MTIRSFFRHQCHKHIRIAEKFIHKRGICVLHFARICKILSRVFLNFLICTICIKCVYLYVYMCIHGRIHIYIYIYTYVRMYVHTYVHTYIHTYIHAYFLKCMYDRKCIRNMTTREHHMFAVISSCMLFISLQQKNQNCQHVCVGMGDVICDWDGKVRLISQHFSKISVLNVRVQL